MKKRMTLSEDSLKHLVELFFKDIGGKVINVRLREVPKLIAPRPIQAGQWGHAYIEQITKLEIEYDDGEPESSSQTSQIRGKEISGIWLDELDGNRIAREYYLKYFGNIPPLNFNPKKKKTP